MIRVRPAKERGHANHGWLDTYHTFSFADYQDPAYMGFRKLRVINEDFVEQGRGFGTHPHRDMEIITYVLQGNLAHKDSMGNGSVIRPGDVQRMSAGTGVTHSEFNHSKDEPVHLLQIWIFPEKSGLTPSYEQTHFSVEERAGKLRLLASPEPVDKAVKIHQDAQLFAAVLDKGQEVKHVLKNDRYAWLQVARGTVSLNGTKLKQGDGASISEESLLTVIAQEPSEVLLFDLS